MPALTRCLAASPSLRALRHRSYRAWTAAGLVSIVGSWMQLVAQNWVMLEHTRNGAMVGLTIAVQALPGLLLGMWAGGVVDRCDRRRVLILTQSLLGLLALALALVVLTGRTSVTALLVLSALTGCVTVFDGPASGAFGAGLLPAGDLANGLALGSLVSSAGRVGGMAAAGVAVAAVGPAAACLVNAASFAAPIAVLVALRRTAPAPADVTACAAGDRSPVAPPDALAGVRHMWSLPEVRATLALAWVCGCFGRNFQVTTALMADSVFHGGAALYGGFSTAFALGTVAGGIVATRLRGLGRFVLVASAGAAATLQVLGGVLSSVPMFTAVLAAIGAGAVVLDTTVAASVQLATDPLMRGRVLAVCSLVGGTAGLVGGPLLGWIGQHAGARTPFLVGGAVTVGAVATYAALAVRRAARARGVSTGELLVQHPIAARYRAFGQPTTVAT